MKIKKLILGLSSIGLLATVTPICLAVTNQITSADSQNIQSLHAGNNATMGNVQSLDVSSKLTEIKSINKSCEKLISFDLSERGNPSNMDSRIKIEDGSETDDGVKEGKVERDDLFTCDRTDSQYSSYFRYKSNNIDKSNHTSWGNAKKYQLDVAVPANTKEYNVQVVADVKIKNCLNGAFSPGFAKSFAQAKLSPLSINPNETLMPYIGIKDENRYSYDCSKFNIKTQNDFFRLFENIVPWEQKPYDTAKLSSFITLSNETPKVKVIPVYFWYGFFGGGYDGQGLNSHINCSEVTFTANHIEKNLQNLEVGSKLTAIKTINKSGENLVSFDLAKVNESSSSKNCISNIDSRIKIEDGSETDAKEGKIERQDLFTCTRINKQYESYFRYKSNHVEKNNHTSWSNAKKYQLNVTVPANAEEYKVQVVADVKIKNCLEGGWSGPSTFVQAKLSQLSTNPNEILMPYIGIKDENVYKYDGKDFKITTQNDLFRIFNNGLLWEQKPYETATLSSTIALSNDTPEDKEIPVYFWYGFSGGGYNGHGPGSHINCSEVTFSANHIE